MRRFAASVSSRPHLFGARPGLARGIVRVPALPGAALAAADDGGAEVRGDERGTRSVLWPVERPTEVVIDDHGHVIPDDHPDPPRGSRLTPLEARRVEVPDLE